MGQHFSFVGRQIKQDLLRRTWEETGAILKNKYPVEDTPMPRIEALCLTYECFSKAIRQLLSSPYIIDATKIEWGEQLEARRISAGSFFSDVDQKWAVLVCEGLNPLEQNLRHELLHIWESILGLQLGTLTQSIEGGIK